MPDLRRSTLPGILVWIVAGCGTHSDTVETAAPNDAGHLVLTQLDGTIASAPPPQSIPCGFVSPDAGASLSLAPNEPASRFVTQVLSFCEGTCAGFNAADVLATVSGPPVGGGASQGSYDVVSLGGGGSIIVGFGANAIVDGPGVDFIVFENPFDYGDNRYVEPGEVSVSDDGVAWTAFPCADLTQAEPDGGWGATQCGGMNLVYSNPDNDISPFDVARAGGDQYDLATIGVKHANYVRIRNIVASEECPEAGTKPNKNGFDLDAIAVVNAELQ